MPVQVLVLVLVLVLVTTKRNKEKEESVLYGTLPLKKPASSVEKHKHFAQALFVNIPKKHTRNILFVLHACSDTVKIKMCFLSNVFCRNVSYSILQMKPITFKLRYLPNC